jgi:hypothetical protein
MRSKSSLRLLLPSCDSRAHVSDKLSIQSDNLPELKLMLTIILWL